MKLQIVAPATGVLWVKLGMLSFFKQPLALSGLMLLGLALLSVAAWVPLIGGLLSLSLFPAFCLGMMAATAQAHQGKFASPKLLFIGLSQGRARPMLQLGILYALGVVLALGLSALVDGGKLAQLYLGGGNPSRGLFEDPEVLAAFWLMMLAYLPLSLAFWHAPALVYWHGVPPLKSLFFSLVACVKNFKAFLVYGLLWVALLFGASLLVVLMATLFGNPQAALVAMIPAGLLLSTLFFCSIYFCFCDSFAAPEATNTSPTNTHPPAPPGEF